MRLRDWLAYAFYTIVLILGTVMSVGLTYYMFTGQMEDINIFEWAFGMFVVVGGTWGFVLEEVGAPWNWVKNERRLQIQLREMRERNR